MNMNRYAEANNFQAYHEFPRIFVNRDLPHLQEPRSGFFSEPDESIPNIPIPFL